MTFKQDIPTGPFDLTDMLGEDRLVFTHVIVGSTFQATRELEERAIKIYMENSPGPSERREFDIEIFITGEDSFELEIESALPNYSLEKAREARGELEANIPNSIITLVEISSINVSNATGRRRDLLGKNLWMKFLTREVLDLDVKEASILESKIRENNRHDIRPDIIDTEDNITMNLNESRYELQKLIEFGIDAGNIMRDELDVKIGEVKIASGNNFSVRL